MKSQIYDQAKYKAGGATEICPAKIPEEIRQKVQRMAVKIFKTIGCLDLARADFIWRASDNKLYFLEINTIPGMTATSLAPQAAKAAGIEFSEFLDKLIESALKRSSDERYRSNFSQSLRAFRACGILLKSVGRRRLRSNFFLEKKPMGEEDIKRPRKRFSENLFDFIISSVL